MRANWEVHFNTSTEQSWAPYKDHIDILYDSPHKKVTYTHLKFSFKKIHYDTGHWVKLTKLKEGLCGEKTKQMRQNRVGNELRRKQMKTEKREKEMWVSALCVFFFLSSCLSSCQRISHSTTTGPLEGRLKYPHRAWKRPKER